MSVLDTLPPEAKAMLGRLGIDPRDVDYVGRAWNLKRRVPKIVLRDGTMYILDIDLGEAFEAVETSFVPMDNDYGIENCESLEGEPIYELYEAYYEELQYYGNGFTLLIPLSNGVVVAVRGQYLDNTVVYTVPVDDLSDDEYEEVKRWLDRNRLSVWSLFGGYRWRPSDAYRGVYTHRGDVKEWEKVFEGWVSTFAGGDRVLRRLSEIERLRTSDLPSYPVLFAFPRSSNITVAYFDVWVPKGMKEDFLRLVGAEEGAEGFDLDDGHWYRAVAADS